MEKFKRKILVVITEALIEDKLVADFKRIGARGYTIVQAYGEGSRGKRSADLDGAQNIRIEIVCDTSLCDRMMDHLSSKYMSNYAMILYVSDVEVIRAQKFI